jgi:hypothetical protein
MNQTRDVSLIVAVALFLLPASTPAQVSDAPDGLVANIPANYTESKVGAYTLPDPLTLASGQKVRDAKTWFDQRRPEILRRFEENQYGKAPGRPADMTFETLEQSAPAFDNKAIRRQIRVHFTREKPGRAMDILIYLPAGKVADNKPVPLLLNLSFTANALAVKDTGIVEGEIWDPRQKRRVAINTATARRFGGLNVPSFLEHGLGVATVYYGDIDPDSAGAVDFGVRKLYLKPGQAEPAPDEWGAICAWAWGLSRALDYFEADRQIDAKRVALFGVSRLGKTVLWAAARDDRFAAVIGSCSGEGGAALSRRNYGETIAHMTAPGRFPYQFCANWAKYAKDPSQNPVDAHMLLALIAPRPVLLQTGDTDRWSDPRGEFETAVAAAPVYELLGATSLGTSQMPPSGQPILHTIAYYMHKGGHGSLPTDWPIFFDFLQTHFKP